MNKSYNFSATNAKKQIAFLVIFMSLLMKFSFSQNSWQKTYNISPGGINGANNVVQTLDGGFATIGSTNNPPTAGSNDIVLNKYDINGNIQWSQIYGGTSDDWGYSLAQASDGSYYLGGYTRSFGTI
ncbi:MAG TPA: hypothetical protein VNY73_06670, partial [Bacteroidia bacterium]|nr:hypothetical protein [Bacteroidia bacterium]